MNIVHQNISSSFHSSHGAWFSFLSIALDMRAWPRDLLQPMWRNRSDRNFKRHHHEIHSVSFLTTAVMEAPTEASSARTPEWGWPVGNTSHLRWTYHMREMFLLCGSEPLLFEEDYLLLQPNLACPYWNRQTTTATKIDKLSGKGKRHHQHIENTSSHLWVKTKLHFLPITLVKLLVK